MSRFELLLDRFHLLAQVELALALGKLTLHLRLDAPSQLEQFQLARQVPMDLVEAGLRVELFEQLLPFRGA